MKRSTFSNTNNRNVDTAYVFIEDKFIEIFKESAWLKTNMGSRKIYYDNIASIDKTAFLNDADLTIGCNYHSYAHNFAVENNIPYKIIGGVMIGDVNGDDGITIMDATIIQKKLLGMDTLDVVEYYDLAADVNRDGIVNIRDVTLIQMYVAGIITEF